MLTMFSIATFITSDIVSKTVSTTINVLSNTLAFMTTNSENESIKKYKEELELIDIKFKLDIIHEWITTGSDNKIENPNLNKLYESIVSLCKDLTEELEKIERKIVEHTKLWFRSWRKLDLEKELFAIKNKCLILNERLVLITFIQYGRNNIDQKK
jgi:hypothetical protein